MIDGHAPIKISRSKYHLLFCLASGANFAHEYLQHTTFERIVFGLTDIFI
jgi:hypothetical protein